MSNYEKCNGCPYYYGEIDNCMFGEEGVPDNMKKTCEVNHEQNDKNKYFGVCFRAG